MTVGKILPAGKGSDNFQDEGTKIKQLKNRLTVKPDADKKEYCELIEKIIKPSGNTPLSVQAQNARIVRIALEEQRNEIVRKKCEEAQRLSRRNLKGPVAEARYNRLEDLNRLYCAGLERCDSIRNNWVFALKVDVSPKDSKIASPPKNTKAPEIKATGEKIQTARETITKAPADVPAKQKNQNPPAAVRPIIEYAKNAYTNLPVSEREHNLANIVTQPADPEYLVDEDGQRYCVDTETGKEVPVKQGRQGMEEVDLDEVADSPILSMPRHSDAAKNANYVKYDGEEEEYVTDVEWKQRNDERKALAEKEQAQEKLARQKRKEEEWTAAYRKDKAIYDRWTTYFDALQKGGVYAEYNGYRDSGKKSDKFMLAENKMRVITTQPNGNITVTDYDVNGKILTQAKYVNTNGKISKQIIC